jgi:predicted Rdx family selenoprotein
MSPGGAMQTDKETVLGLLRDQGKTNEAKQAGQRLPDQVDTERDAGFLERFGVNPPDLIGRVTGSGGIPGL